MADPAYKIAMNWRGHFVVKDMAGNSLLDAAQFDSLEEAEGFLERYVNIEKSVTLYDAEAKPVTVKG